MGGKKKEMQWLLMCIKVFLPRISSWLVENCRLLINLELDTCFILLYNGKSWGKRARQLHALRRDLLFSTRLAQQSLEAAGLLAQRLGTNWSSAAGGSGGWEMSHLLLRFYCWSRGITKLMSYKTAEVSQIVRSSPHTPKKVMHGWLERRKAPTWHIFVPTRVAEE